MHSLNNRILQEWLMKCNFRVNANTRVPADTTTAKPVSASAPSKKAWLTDFLDIDSVIDTPECKYQMSQIKIAIMQATIPSFRSQEVEEHDMTLTNFEPGCLGVRVMDNDNNDPNGNFFFGCTGSSRSEGSDSSESDADANSSRTTYNEISRLVLDMNRPYPTDQESPVHDPGNCAHCTQGVPIPIVTSGYLGTNVTSVSVVNVTTVTTSAWVGQVMAGSSDPAIRLATQFYAVPMELNQCFLDTMNFTLMDESIGPQEHIPGISEFDGPRRWDGNLAGFTTDPCDPVVQSAREKLRQWAMSSPQNLEMYGRLLLLDPSVQLTLQKARTFQTLKSKLSKPRIGDIDDDADEETETLEGSQDVAKSRMVKKHNSRNRRDRAGHRWCNFCLKSGVGDTFSRSHYMKDPVTGVTQCPRLLMYKCPLCGELGHTKSYCNRASSSNHRKNQHQ